ncbi:ribosomal oxygenase 1 [Temnothorax nylanderi]|uniref:ribosomal oxygenase 1 n=1 Tax=Temnothorax nylanderi TaxID=102681 RepID=UPI003A8647D4
MESVSAFSVYAGKRKNTEQYVSGKKKKRNLQKVSNKKSRKQKDVKQTDNANKQMQRKDKKIKSTRKLNDVNGVQSNKINNIRNMHRKLKLKAIKERKNKNKKNSVKREAIQTDKILTRDIEIGGSDNDSSDTNCTSPLGNASNEINEKYDDDHNPIELKAIKEQRKKSRKNSVKRESTQMINKILTKDIEMGNSESDLNDTNCTSPLNNEINEEEEDDHNPIEFSRHLFQWLLQPINIETFFKKNWEKTPLYVKRDMPNFYKHLVSTPLLDQVLRKNHILFTKNIDITSYSDGVRETHNPPGRALPSVVWDYYQNKCSIRMLNPQTFIPAIHAMNATLQEFFGCFVGANLYLTPPNSQGFAPHYDDVEAFIFQIEGQKRWRLYKPLNENEYLPRYSSKNFDQSEIGEPILDTIVKAGDLLYLPRGTIHQGMTLEDTHSLHITLSVYQKNSWVDLLEKALPQALQRAAENDSRFREGLPLNYLKYVGTACNTNDRKDVFKNNIKNLISLLLEHIDVDNAADLMAKDHIHDFLPPFLMKKERKCTVAEDGEIMTNDGVVKNCAEILPETRIRLLRLHCMRLIKEDTCRIYYSTENSKEYHEYEPQFLEVDEKYVPGIKKMIISYPNFISVKELPIEDDEEKIQIVKDLWEKGLILTEEPLC